MIFSNIIILLSLINNSFGLPSKHNLITVCYNNISKSPINDNKPRVIDVISGSTVHLKCNHCYTNKDYYPKLWYFKPRGGITNEVEINYDNKNKMSITIYHTLKIYSFNLNDSGIYSCKNNNNGITFIYILDGVTCEDVPPKIGPISQWPEFKQAHIDPFNQKMKISFEVPYNTFRSHYNMILNMYTVWDNWSDCKAIDSYPRGLRKRLGRCRIGPATNNIMTNTKQVDTEIITSYITDGYDVPCRSLMINKYLPEISRVIRSIPDFEAQEICVITTKGGKRKVIKNIRNKNRTIKQVMENSHVILICSEVIDINADIKWFKDRKLLKSFNGHILKSGIERHIFTDDNMSLHLLHISKKEEGNYTCSLNGEKTSQYDVKVVSKTKFLNQEFLRYSIYLAFVLCLTMTCYCAGVCVAWHRRASFADPLDLYKKENKTKDRFKMEKELLFG